MDMPRKQLVAEALIDLHRRLSTLPTRSHERRVIMQETANLYGVSEQTLYRALARYSYCCLGAIDGPRLRTHRCH